MTRTTNARIAGFTFLFYIATGVDGMIFFDQAIGGQDTSTRFASIAAHAGQMRLSIVFALINVFNALILIWLPMLVFEVTFGFRLLIKGVNAKASPVAAA
jgi:hypothetical protein